jgi:hypothetical protein
MKSGEPPRVATWLLEHFGPEQNQEELAGDLLEGYRQGRSKAWYWRQVLPAICRRRHLIFLVWAAGTAWVVSCSPWALALREPDFSLSPQADMAVLTIIFLACGYLYDMLSRRMRVVAAVGMVAVLCLLYLYRPALLYHYHYDIWALFFSLFSYRRPWVAILVLNLFSYRKWFPQPRFRMTLRELLKGDPDRERKRAIDSLTLAMMEEPNPEVREAYEQSISILQDNPESQP